MFFRASTAERGRALRLRGHASNQPDGSVLIVAGGAVDALAQFVQWLHTGPPMARVDSVEVEVIEPAAMDWPPGFMPR